MWNDRIEQVKQNRLRRAQGGGEAKIRQQHQNEKLTAPERIEFLLDEGSFIEINGMREPDESASSFRRSQSAPGDGVYTGWGTIDGRRVCVVAEDFTVVGGTLGVVHAQKITHIQDLALEMRVPIIFLNDSGGARIEEGINSLSGYGAIFQRHVRASGVIPQICAILGPCCGGASYSPALCDFIFVVRDISKMFITGPDVVEAALGTRPTFEELGGASMHSSTSGVAHALYNDERSCLRGIRKLLSYLPSSCDAAPPELPGPDVLRGHEQRLSFENIVPDNMRKAYDMHLVIDNLMDQDAPLFEIQKHFASNVITGFSYLNRQVTGIVSNQPLRQGGSIDCNASDKIARFVRFCDCFRIPLLTLVDVPAFLPGIDQEQKGIIRHGAKILYAYSEATVPKITVILRKAYGGAYIAMNSKSMSADIVYAWPIAEIAVMGAAGAVKVLYKKQIAAAADPQREAERLEQSYEESFLNTDTAENKGFIDEVILPEETRSRLITGFSFLSGKDSSKPGRKHGNIPL